MIAGNWPSAHDYIGWAQDQGCVVTIVQTLRDGRALHIVSIASQAGQTAIEVVMELADPLMSSTVARLDRRLGMKSHLFR